MNFFAQNLLRAAARDIYRMSASAVALRKLNASYPHRNHAIMSR
jgi:hypothetical protein